MNKRPVLGLALLVSALVVVAAGCGSSKKGPYSASKADYATALNAICVSVNAKTKALSNPTTLSDLAVEGQQVLVINQNGIAQISKLGTPPSEIKTEVADFLTQQSKGLALLKQLITAAKANDTAKVKALAAQGKALDPAVNADATAIGAPACLSTAH